MSTKPKTQWTASEWWAAFKASKKNATVEDLSDFVRANAAWINPHVVPEPDREGRHWVRMYDAHHRLRLIVFLSLDYLGLGHDDPYLRTPVTPQCAQQIADHFGCMLPTPAIVDAAVEQFARLPAHTHERTVYAVWVINHQTDADLWERVEAGHETLCGHTGHRKDVVLTDALPPSDDGAYGAPNPVRTRNVAIYGWHGALGPNPIQPLYTKHSAGYVDYSHGVRLVSCQCAVFPAAGGPAESRNLLDVMSDPELGPLVCGKDYPLAFRSYPMLGGEKPLVFTP